VIIQRNNQTSGVPYCYNPTLLREQEDCKSRPAWEKWDFILKIAGHQWLTPVILAIQEAEEDLSSKPAWTNSSREPMSKKPFTHTKKGLVEWLKV
jgi:hypothetical protein